MLPAVTINSTEIVRSLRCVDHNCGGMSVELLVTNNSISPDTIRCIVTAEIHYFPSMVKFIKLIVANEVILIPIVLTVSDGARSVGHNSVNDWAVAAIHIRC